MIFNQYERDLMAIMNSIFGKHPDNAPGEYDSYSALFKLADQQKLLPFIFEHLRRLPVAGEDAELFAVTKKQVIAQVVGQTVRSAEFASVYRALREAGLHPIMIKGQLCDRLYPLRDHRISADDDMLISDDEFFACHELLLSLGLTTDTPDDSLATADEVSYRKAGTPLYIELHRRLFDSSEDAHDDLNSFFANARERSVEADGFLSLPPHEHLLYLILHAYKHFVACGIGLRQFCDIGLWAKNYFDKIDWPLLRFQCAEVHAATFADAAFKIARDVLGIDFALSDPWGADIDVEPLLHDTLSGGIFGSNDYTRLHSSTVTLNAVRSNRRGKKSGLLRSIFPPRRYLEGRYQYLKRHHWLLPVAWVQRICHYAGEKRSDKKNNSASGSIKLGHERIELMRMYDIIE